MIWTKDYVESQLASAGYTEARVWEAVIPEWEHNIDLDGYPGCREIEGYAVDLEGDTRADIFLYERKFLEPVAIRGPNLGSYLHGPACFQPRRWSRHIGCGQEPLDLDLTGFPFSGRVLPDTYGKIRSILVAAGRPNQGPILEFIERRPDLQCQIFYPAGRTIPGSLSFVEREYLRGGRFLPEKLALYDWDFLHPFRTERAAFALFPYYEDEACGEPPCSEMLWVQDLFLVGVNQFGMPFAQGDLWSGQSQDFPPVSRFLGFQHLSDFSPRDGGDILSSSTHLFFADRGDGLTSQSNFLHLIGDGLTPVEIDMEGIHGAAHLDMILTPTEERREGRPVVLVADAVPGDLFKSEKEGIDRIARSLTAFGFHVMRIPYVFTGRVERPDDGDPERPFAYSYNNVLMERYREGGRLVKRVYLPVYKNQESYNQEAASAYRRLGYEVVPIRGLERVSDRFGSLRCMIKVTGRSHL